MKVIRVQYFRGNITCRLKSLFHLEMVKGERAASIIGTHVTPEQAGEVFARTKPRLAVYSHIILATATNDDLIPGTRKAYDDPLEVGEDLMVIEVGKEISVRRPSTPRQ